MKIRQGSGELFASAQLGNQFSVAGFPNRFLRCTSRSHKITPRALRGTRSITFFSVLRFFCNSVNFSLLERSERQIRSTRTKKPGSKPKGVRVAATPSKINHTKRKTSMKKQSASRFTVKDVNVVGRVYDPSLNIETSDTLLIP
jgi:hypothetical protein